MNNTFALLRGTALALLAGFALAGCGGPPETPRAPEDQTAPAKPAERAGGPVVVGEVAQLEKRLAGAAGRVVVVNFWATWCPPCVAEMPELARFHKEYVPEKAAFVSVSLDDPATADDAVARFHEQKSLPFDVLVLNERNPDALTDVLKTELSGALPTTLVYDDTGRLTKTWERAITLDELKHALEPLL